MKKILLATVFLLTSAFALKAQNVAIKTNLLYDATATINLGVEVGLAPKWTFDLSGDYNGWTFKENKKWKHWFLQPEARYWFCEKFNGHFLGLHLIGGQYNAGGIKLPFGIYPGLEKHRYEGYCFGGGLGYGYQWLLSDRWSIGAEVGLGYVRAYYDRYECPVCGDWKGNGFKNYWGVTKLALSLIFMIK